MAFSLLTGKTGLANDINKFSVLHDLWSSNHIATLVVGGSCQSLPEERCVAPEEHIGLLEEIKVRLQVDISI